jgi:hypothetical protein
LFDCEGKILARDEDIYDGIIAPDDRIEVREWDQSTWRYKTVAIYTGEAARKYMEANGNE